METKNKKIIGWILLALIVGGGFFVRLHNIDIVPAGIYPDEAVNGTDAILANETGDYKIFYTNNYGREGLFINLVAFSIKLFGNTVFALKFWSIIFGTLTIIGTYLAAKEILGTRRGGLIAAFFLAFSFWSINFSRTGFRAIMVPFLLSFVFYFALKTVRTGKYWPAIAAGFLFGLGFHTYIAFRAAPLVLFVFLIGLIITKKEVFKNYWKQMAVFGAAFAIAILPLVCDFIKSPEHFQSRTGAISIFSPEVNQGKLLFTFAKSLGASLIKYNFWGDQNWRHNFPPYPILNPLIGTLFLVGLIYAVAKTSHLLALRLKNKIRDEKFYLYLLLISWFFTMLVPEFLTAEGLPHALRSIGTMPAVFILAAVPLVWIAGKMERLPSFQKFFAVFFLAVALTAAGMTDIFKYHLAWAQKSEQFRSFDARYKNIAEYLNKLPPGFNLYVFANGHGRETEDGLPVSAQVVKYLTYGKKEITYLKRGDDTTLKRPMIITFMEQDEEIASRIRHFYPQSRAQKIDLQPGYGTDFVSVIIR